MKRLATGANPAELQLGHDVSVEASSALLAYLDSHWYALPKKPANDAQTGLDLCVGGLGAAYFRVAGRTFNRQDPLGRLSYHGTQHLATLGALTDYDRNKDEAENSWGWEHWQGIYDWDEANVRRISNAQHRWHLEQLVILRDDERVRCGYVTRVALDSHGELSVTLRLWPGTPTALGVRRAHHDAVGGSAGAGHRPRRHARGEGRRSSPRRASSIRVASCARSTRVPSAASA